MTTCKKCGGALESRIAAQCRHCGAERTHRDCYPDQYAHPLVGKRVRLRTRTGYESTGRVLRVVNTRFGLLAHLDSEPADTAYLVGDCHPVD